jgi:hypothetical protein
VNCCGRVPRLRGIGAPVRCRRVFGRARGWHHCFWRGSNRGKYSHRRLLAGARGGSAFLFLSNRLASRSCCLDDCTRKPGLVDAFAALCNGRTGFCNRRGGPNLPTEDFWFSLTAHRLCFLRNTLWPWLDKTFRVHLLQHWIRHRIRETPPIIRSGDYLFSTNWLREK